jgi:TRAP-type C4-dicarboxylate transport system permease small subunit
MESIFAIVMKTSRVLHDIAGAALTVMMCLTVADVVGRAGGHPILGTYEMVGLLGVVVIGFGTPFTSWTRGHVYMEFVLDRLPQLGKDIMNIGTRILCIGLFMIVGINLFQVAADFRLSGEVSSTLKLPIYPVTYAAGICCFVQCVVFMCEIAKILKETEHE